MSKEEQTEADDFQAALDRQEATEEIEVWTGAYSIRMFLPAISLALPITGALVSVAWRRGADADDNSVRYGVEGILVLGWLVLLGWACFRVLGTEYMLTNKRFYFRRGFGHPGPRSIELASCLEVRVYQSRLERWLRSGRITLVLGMGRKARCVLAGVPDPERVASIFRKHIREANPE